VFVSHMQCLYLVEAHAAFVSHMQCSLTFQKSFSCARVLVWHMLCRVTSDKSFSCAHMQCRLTLA
jgi:hypothetical protein